MRKKSVSSTSRKTSSILDRAKPVSEMETVISACFYGRSGTGKTTVAGSFPKPILFVDIGEKGTDSVADQEGIESIRVENWAEVEDIYWAVKGGGTKYKTVVIDSVHAMQAVAIMEGKLLNGKKESDQTSKRDFGTASGILNTWIPNYRDLIEDGINVVFLCHDKLTEVDSDEEDDGMILPEVGPRLMPSVAGTLLGAVNIVGHTFIREELTKALKPGQKRTRKIEYCMRIGPHSYYATKIRRPKSFSVPEYIVDPSYDKLLNVIQGKTERTQPTPRRAVRRTTKR